MRSRLILLVCTLQLCRVAVSVGAEPLEWRETSGDERDALVKCTISLPKDCKILAGEKLPLTYQVEAQRSTTTYNVFVDGRIPIPFSLAVFNRFYSPFHFILLPAVGE